jgi:hypothetical protein
VFEDEDYIGALHNAPTFEAFPITAIGSVYFVRAGESDLVKIGFTSGEPGQRCRALQTGSPSELVLEEWFAGSPADERSLHEVLGPRRVRGEWFQLSPVEVRRLARSVGWLGLTVTVCGCGHLEMKPGAWSWSPDECGECWGARYA